MKTYVPNYILKGVTTTTRYGKNTTSMALHKDYFACASPTESVQGSDLYNKSKD